MNNLIEKLAKEHLVRDEHTEFGWQECHKYVFDSEELKKFAELIVRECGNIAFEHWALTHNTSPQETILKHFEVENLD